MSHGRLSLRAADTTDLAFREPILFGVALVPQTKKRKQVSGPGAEKAHCACRLVSMQPRRKTIRDAAYPLAQVALSDIRPCGTEGCRSSDTNVSLE